ncbi:flagellar filament capping protein FliD [Pullulanibacillus sp. KACC 23026]|uniref:flagellar filament capping protein FliD n=1 Tax=Pullulanibacillus sp. KACC 23026 TaxID=3028315 RepID=UPI0023AEDB1F|nr:flagellar filament capping protein FliD [Pullulanibacillus sp. KACC 23026]WEG11255.1 flagellar filament capping protein FliD [Pullulanibacillus sp. KACC 23026]
MATSSTSLSNVNLTTHLTGLASGLDTQSMVDSLMQASQGPLDKLNQDKIINEWKTEAYQDLNTQIAAFRDSMQDLRLQGTFNSQTVTSNSSSVGVSMSGTASQMNYTISEATLATPATSGSVSFDTQFPSGSTVINQNDPSAGDATFTLNGVAITIPKTSTFDQAIATINSSSDQTHVKAANVGGSLVFTTTGMGSGNSITITGSNADATSLLNIEDGTTNTSSDAAQTSSPPSSLFADASYTDGADGSNGYVVINGLKVNISSNTFNYDGVQFTLNNSIPTGSSVGVSVAPDTDTIFDKIKSFVDNYNTLIQTINSKISETKDSDYPPLTDDQKKDMSDDEITQWTDKAKTGILSNDSTLQQFLTQMRTSLSDVVQSSGINTSFDTLSEIGITTSTDYKDNGKLVLDETKLKSVLNTNLSDVQNLFSARYSTGNSSDTTLTNSTDYKNSGLGVRVYDSINNALSQLALIAGSPGTVSTSSNLAQQAASLNDQISQEQDRLDQYENSLWTKFDNMETALSQLNSQSSWLTSMLSGSSS